MTTTPTKARTTRLARFEPGQRVEIVDPPTRDATGLRYRAGINHGRTGVILGEGVDEQGEAYKVGSEILYDVQFDDAVPERHKGKEADVRWIGDDKWFHFSAQIRVATL